MAIDTIFLALCVLCGLWNVVISLIVYNSLKIRGVPVSFFWLRMMVPKYVFQYKEITHSETGRAGPLFYHWLISIDLALVFAVIAVISRL
jgi:hypothetical protein